MCLIGYMYVSVAPFGAMHISSYSHFITRSVPIGNDNINYVSNNCVPYRNVCASNFVILHACEQSNLKLGKQSLHQALATSTPDNPSLKEY